MPDSERDTHLAEVLDERRPAQHGHLIIGAAQMLGCSGREIGDGRRVPNRIGEVREGGKGHERFIDLGTLQRQVRLRLGGHGRGPLGSRLAEQVDRQGVHHSGVERTSCAFTHHLHGASRPVQHSLNAGIPGDVQDPNRHGHVLASGAGQRPTTVPALSQQPEEP